MRAIVGAWRRDRKQSLPGNEPGGIDASEINMEKTIAIHFAKDAVGALC